MGERKSARVGVTVCVSECAREGDSERDREKAIIK